MDLLVRDKADLTLEQVESCLKGKLKSKGPELFRAKYFSLRSRLGPKKAIMAIAHRLLKALFHVILTVSDTGQTKPDPSLYETIVSRLGCAMRECLMVGDNPGIDLDPARKLGMQTLLVQHVSDIYRMEAWIRAAATTRQRETGTASRAVSKCP